MKQRELVPKRRFVGFKDEWEFFQLDEVLYVNSGRDYKYLNKGNIPVYGTGGLMLSVDDKLSEIDGIGIGRKGTIDKPQYLKAPFWTVDTLFFMTPSPKTNLDFMFSKSQIIDWRKMDESTGVPSLSKVNIEKIPLYVPKYKEQQKIGQFFKHFDEMITLEQRKIDKTKALKSAYLAEMFPAEGERVPKRRFAEFKDVWKKMQLGDVLCVNSGKDYKHLNQGNIPVYGTGGLMLYVDDKLSNVDGIGIGRKGTLDRPQYLKAPFWTVDTLYFLTSIHKVDLYFMYVKTQTIDWKKKDESSGVPSLSKNSIEKTTIYLPCIKEQHKLGAFFKKIDATILNHQRKLDKLKATKQAYLHEMFV